VEGTKPITSSRTVAVAQPPKRSKSEENKTKQPRLCYFKRGCFMIKQISVGQKSAI
jgi:hypothetical protein